MSYYNEERRTDTACQKESQETEAPSIPPSTPPDARSFGILNAWRRGIRRLFGL